MRYGGGWEWHQPGALPFNIMNIKGGTLRPLMGIDNTVTQFGDGGGGLDHNSRDKAFIRWCWKIIRGDIGV